MVILMQFRYLAIFGAHQSGEVQDNTDCPFKRASVYLHLFGMGTQSGFSKSMND